MKLQSRHEMRLELIVWGEHASASGRPCLSPRLSLERGPSRELLSCFEGGLPVSQAQVDLDEFGRWREVGVFDSE